MAAGFQLGCYRFSGASVTGKKHHIDSGDLIDKVAGQIADFRRHF
jgi:hypothetical protein